MNDDMFGLKEIFEDKETGRDLSSVVGLLIRLVLAVTTAGFFYVYAGNLFAWLTGPTYSPWASAVVGTFCVDFLAWAWSHLRENSATTETQISAAKNGTIANMGLSVVVTVVFFVLLTDFVQTHNADGSLNDLGLAVNIAGLLVGTLAIAGNGALWAYYVANGIESRAALDAAKLRAAQMKGQFEVNREQSRLVIMRTIGDIKEQLPTLAAGAGRSNADQFFRTRFREIDKDGDGSLSNAEIARWVAEHPDEAAALAARMQNEQSPTRSDNGRETTPHRTYRDENGRTQAVDRYGNEVDF